MFIELTNKDGKLMLVNTEFIAMIKPFGGNTRISFNNSWVDVLEDYDFVYSMIVNKEN